MLSVRGKWNYFAALVMTSSLLIGVAMAQGKTQTLTGNVADQMCGVKHTMMKNTPDKECTLGCVKLGSKYGLVVGDKGYTLDGKEADLEKFAGQKAKVTGTVDGTTVHVTAVGPA